MAATEGDLLDKQFQQAKKQAEQQEYQQLAQQVKPSQTWLKNAVAAFVVGGAITAIAQIIQNLFQAGGLTSKEAGTSTLVVMVFLGAFFTGLGIYDNLGKFAGAGSIVPITGFANSIVAPALEFKREGYVYGVAAKMFTVAGPVLVYGFVVSVIIGLVTFFLQ
ncbi:stage V sporulation protein AC [Metallumcola ferriviriculae]|uniref:Stage V sporulation protein AC n=1 Tax=Metallumcola ferriviriculae TaxID=3039180 RepID=A0AAU0URV3_9FIRM|nr:stage V sporulation protein AC [Desulfitibacteraceae bacterium MK1]